MIRIIYIALLLPISLLLGQETVDWIPSHDFTPPSARPFDHFILSAPAHSAQSAGVRNIIDVVPGDAHNTFGSAHVLEWTANAFAAPGGTGYALLRCTLPADAAGKIAGLRITFDAETAGSLDGRFYECQRNFWGATKLCEQKQTHAAGMQTLVWRIDEKLPRDKAAKVNGFALAAQLGNGAPLRIRIHKIELVFSTAPQAADFRAAKQKRLLTDLALTADWIKARGVDSGFPADGDARLNPAHEQKLWHAAQLVALGEQLSYWTSFEKKLPPPSSPPPPPVLAELRDEHTTLVRDYPALAPAQAQQRVDALQKRTDAQIDALLEKLPLNARRWDRHADDQFFRTPDGERYRMFGPAFFRSIYSPRRGAAAIWRPWDVRYISALGFTGFRLIVQWNLLEPTRGVFDPAYLGMLLDIIREAERYGLGISIDFHWPYPDWFLRGPENFRAKKEDIHSHASYHWPDAVVSAWERLGAALKDAPNIVAFEVPGNETNLANVPRGIKAYPLAWRMWNDWLKQAYNNDRASLAAAWKTTDAENTRHSLQDNENWDDHSIEPLGYQNDKNPADAYENNPRFQDHLRFVAWLQQDTTARILAALRKNIPDAEGMMQHTMGDVWDRSPVPVNYQALHTLYGPHVNPGTHYGMGGLNARKAVSLTFKSWDSEQQMENRWNQVERHVRLGAGFCIWAFHARGGGGMLFSGDDWYLKPEVTFLPERAEWIRSYWPDTDPENAAPVNAPRVAVIENTRRAAAMQSTLGDLVGLLEKNNAAISVFEGMRIVKEPSLLKKCGVVIVDANQIDADLVDILQRDFTGAVLLHGRLDRDAFARTGAHATLARLARDGILFANVQETGQRATEQPGVIDLEGVWDWAYAGLGKAPNIPSMPAPKVPPPSNLKWTYHQVPAEWGEVGLLGSSRYYTGDVWYRKKVHIPADWKGRSLRLLFGAIDDFDWVFLNGKLIGKTGPERSNWWTAPRDYTLPAAHILWGAENEILVCVRNDGDNGGITKSPVAIVSEVAPVLHWTDSGKTGILRISATATRPPSSAVHPDAHVLATLDANTPAFIHHGRWWWWIGDTAWQLGDTTDQTVIRKLLSTGATAAAR
ncbi:endoglucanase [Opitutaceae bacterium TAV1]|nr:endoglucanase [Opitutaceae bacterium TAV1]